jgi:soluble lytic murein transglycosylase-like protein
MKMTWKLGVVILLMMAFCVGIGYRAGVSDKTASAKASVAENARVEIALTKWVFDHSTKISKDTAKVIVKEAAKIERPLLTMAASSVESEFVPSATSSANARGLTQVRWKVWGAELVKVGIAKEERDLYNIDTSLKAGDYILGKLLRQNNGNVQKALDGYLGMHDGPYVNKILANFAELSVSVGRC